MMPEIRHYCKPCMAILYSEHFPLFFTKSVKLYNLFLLLGIQTIKCLRITILLYSRMTQL